MKKLKHDAYASVTNLDMTLFQLSEVALDEDEKNEALSTLQLP